MPMYQWSTTPGNNASAGLINWAEGQAPSTVNDSARQMMADVAVWYQNPEWLNYGLTPTYVSSAQFTVTGNQTTIYSVGRRVRATVTAGTIYGSISVSTYTSLTTVTVSWDSGALDSGLTEADVGLMNPLYSSFPVGLSSIFSSCFVTGNNIRVGSGQNSEIDVILNNNNTAGQFFLNTSGLVGFYDITRSIVRFSTDISGNFTANGNVTANSDERLKCDWSDLDKNFIEQLADVKMGTYTRIDTGNRQVGVSAQSLQSVLPEAVHGETVLSVAYGNAALVAVIALSREVLRLRKLLETTK
ncbi:tail fiber domain-containing protein [Burkholderia cenocepacia]|uniref:tail fiber domain-containing protein n=1 Tax=Burkholderia cenocepacia TaxID=95486 RepID=UPI002B24195C|nr:tail fiber domain-containing protein [Burkholderia cenocepacia]MEB2554040.1 tail fiber domain-containing protein [Burkholderia cenocepacia]